MMNVSLNMHLFLFFVCSRFQQRIIYLSLEVASFGPSESAANANQSSSKHLQWGFSILPAVFGKSLDNQLC